MKERVLRKINFEGKGPLSVKKGISEEQISELLDFSRSDREVRKFTSDAIRFKDRNAFNDWRKKRRLIYSLSDSAGHLLGVAWFGPKVCPVGKLAFCRTTFAIRIYGEARGKGLAIDFMKAAFKDYWRFHPQTQGIWLETSIGNSPARKLYEKFGFQTVPATKKKEKIIMTFEPRK